MSSLRLSLRSKLLGGFFLVALIGLAGWGFALASVASTGRIAGEQFDRVARPSAALTRVSVIFQRMSTGARDILIADNDADLVRAQTFMEAQKADMESASSDYLACNISAADRDKFKAFQEKLSAYAASIDELSASPSAGKARGSAMAALKVLKGQAVGLQASIDALQSSVEALSEKQAKAARASISRVILEASVFGLASLALSALLGVAIARSISSPVRRMGRLAESVAAGELGQGLAAADLSRADELGALARAVEAMRGGIIESLGRIKSTSDALSELGLALDRCARDSSESASAIVSAAAAAKSRVQEQGAGVTETSATIGEILKGIESLDRRIEEQAGGVERSSAAVEEMVASIRAVTKSAEALGSAFAELGSASSAGSGLMAEMGTRITSMSSMSERLEEANGVVSSIASQTNLLAMNAAIEAAHAGDSGKGFAVVADEIRKLAESSGAQAKSASAALKKMKADMERTNAEAEAVLAQFEAINGRVVDLSDREQSIRSTMREQGAGSQEILKAVGMLNEITARVKEEAEEMLSGSSEVIAESGNLARMTEEVSASMGDMTAGAADIREAVKSVNELSRRNKESVDELSVEVGKFKVE
jgi:Methyl-accepting chemotaxis protein